VAAELFHADRRMDMMKLTVAFRNFANAPKPLYMRIQQSSLWSAAQAVYCVHFYDMKQVRNDEIERWTNNNWTDLETEHMCPL
jgi:hypothetical protein